MTTKQKILVCGDVKGNLITLFNRVENINKKSGPFELLLCAGDFFGDTSELEPYRNGVRQVPVPTYILGPNKKEDEENYPDPNGYEFCPNLSFLGKRGLYTAAGGLKIAYLSGIETKSKVSEMHTFNETDVTAIRDVCCRGITEHRGVDILLTSQWAKDITTLDNSCTQNYNGSTLIAWLSAQIKPRYHIVGLENTYFERKPYRNRNKDDTLSIATRFIALANVGNSSKQKWIYALSLTPVDSMRMSELLQQTTDETACPFSSVMLKGSLKDVTDTSDTQFFYDLSSQTDNEMGRKRKGKGKGSGFEKRPRPTFDQSKCWFCLGSPDVEKHLVISIGNECYLALAKGGIVNDHLLILPITHHQATNGLPESILDEIEKFKGTLKTYFKTVGKVPIFFERNYKTSHLQIQVIPIPFAATRELKEIFQDEAEAHGLQLSSLPEGKRIEDVVPPSVPYFIVELPSGDSLYIRIKSNFPLQFAREVMASGPILNMPERIEWQDCKISQLEEVEIVQKFRESFQEYDFTI